MNCPYCGAPVPSQSQFCSNCGARIPVESMRAYTPQQGAPAPRPPQPLLGMIFGIIGAFLSIITYIVMLQGAVNGDNITAGMILLITPTLGAAVIGLIFSIMGMKRSIRTGGRKYVAGIVFSSVGIACSAFALIYLMLTVFLGLVFNSVRSASYRHYYY